MMPRHADAPQAATASGASGGATHMEPAMSVPAGMPPLSIITAIWAAAWTPGATR